MGTTLLFFILMLVGTATLGYTDIQKKRCLKGGLDEQIILCVSLLVSGVLLALPLLYFGVPVIHPLFWYAVAGTIALNLVSQNLFIRALKYSDASKIAPLRLIIPPLVILTGFLFLREVPSVQGMFGIGVTMVGLWFLLFPTFSAPLKFERGVVYGLLGSILFAISFPLDKMAVVSSSALFATTLILFSLGILTTLFNQLRDTTFIQRMGEASITHARSLFNMSLFYAVGVVTTNQALNYSLAAYASSLKRLQAIWTILFAGAFLKEGHIGKRLLATLVMFAGIILSAFFQ